jgi:hypothetical protein
MAGRNNVRSRREQSTAGGGPQKALFRKAGPSTEVIILGVPPFPRTGVSEVLDSNIDEIREMSRQVRIGDEGSCRKLTGESQKRTPVSREIDVPDLTGTCAPLKEFMTSLSGLTRYRYFTAPPIDMQSAKNIRIPAWARGRNRGHARSRCSLFAVQVTVS